MSKLVSVIIPVYNESKYLPLILDSLLNQSRAADEIIVCDNNSTDNSLHILNSYKDLIPLTIIHQSEKGTLPTLEKAWKASSGDLIIRTDADAILPVNYIKNCLNYYKNHPEICASTGPIFSAEFNLIYTPLYSIGTIICNYFLYLVRGYPLVLGPNTVIRRKAMEKINGYQTKLSIIDDHLLTKKLAAGRLKVAYSWLQYNHHSIRRWLNNPLNILRSILVNFNDSYYLEKNN